MAGERGGLGNWRRGIKRTSCRVVRNIVVFCEDSRAIFGAENYDGIHGEERHIWCHGCSGEKIEVECGIWEFEIWKSCRDDEARYSFALVPQSLRCMPVRHQRSAKIMPQ